MTDEVLGLGPLQDLLDDEGISEIMVVDPNTIYVERSGKIEPTNLRFSDEESCRAAIERIVTPLGRRIDESTPMVDARLQDGSRVNAIIPPLAIRGPCITIRKFSQRALQMDELVSSQSLSPRMAAFLHRCVRAKKNILISGGTGSGKTTLLNVLSAEIPGSERIVTIEDAAELRLNQPHVVALESKPINLEGQGAYTIRDLLKNALRMRPDRILVGECRGGEAIDMLQAMNTGHEGSMTTTHANSAKEALKRIETLCLMAGLDLSSSTIKQQIASSLHIIVQQTRFSDGSRRLTAITEVGALTEQGDIALHDIFVFQRTGLGLGGDVLGEHRSTGYVPSFIEEFITQGLISDEVYL
jgi:pilus assembly protein CpaF